MCLHKPVFGDELTDAILRAVRRPLATAKAMARLLENLESVLRAAAEPRSHRQRAPELGTQLLISALRDPTLDLSTFIVVAGSLRSVARSPERRVIRALADVVHAVRHTATSVAKADPAVVEVVGEIERVAHASRVTRQDVASGLRFTRWHASRVLSKQLRCHLAQLRAAARIRRVTNRLVESTESMKNLAIDAGFVDQSHFVHSFERLFRMTPTEFRGIAQGHLPR
jgi:methylphosphotriester-DNA--protein-cysteine methyltransferase